MTTMETKDKKSSISRRCGPRGSALRQRAADAARRVDLAVELAGADVRLKLESLQVTQAFKARGAFNAA